MGESQSSQDASRFRALGNGVSGAGQGSAGNRELQNGRIAPPRGYYPNGGRSLFSDSGPFDYDTLGTGSNQHFGFSHSVSGNLPDEQSLAFAFEGMSFNSCTTNSPASHCNLPRTNGHYPSGRVDDALSQQHALATRQDDSLCQQFSLQHVRQNNDPKQLGNFSRTFEMHNSNFGVPCYPSTASASPFGSGVPCYPSTASASPFGSGVPCYPSTASASPFGSGVPCYPSTASASPFGSNFMCGASASPFGSNFMCGASLDRSKEQAPLCPPAKGPSSSYVLENGYSYLNGVAFQKRKNSSGLNTTFTDSFPSTSSYGGSCDSGNFHYLQQAEKVFHPYILHHQQADDLTHPYGKLNAASYPERLLMSSDVGNPAIDFHLSPYGHLLSSSIFAKYKSIDEMIGRICILSKDQDACRVLQKLLTEGTQEDIDKIFSEIIDNVGDLMMDPTAHYLVQKILEECTNDQRTHLIREMTKAPITLHKASCNMHGTRVVQKVIDTMNTSEQVSMVASALNTGIVRLMTDSYGSHVVVHCLQKLLPEHKAFLLEAAASRYVQLARDRHGCCVLQKCIVHSSDEQRNNLLFKITSSALALSEDQYGNYVIQFILGLKIEWATARVVDELEGHFGDLSMQKSGSHVVEHCLKFAPRLICDRVINELMHDPRLLHIILDQYGNFVIQTALKQCQGEQHAALVETIRPHTAIMESNMYGKKVLSRSLLKNKHYRFRF